MLECRGLSVFYGQHQALQNVAVTIAEGEIVVILGANGAGKSTLLKAIAGLIPAAAGQILVDGRSMLNLPPHQIVEAGVTFVPEGRRIFADLTVKENLLLGAYARRARDTEREHLDNVMGLFPQLADRKGQVAGTMSGGEQQMVAIGRAMMSAPSILMLDEPSLGLSPLLSGELFRTLAKVRETGVGILLVEQNARQALAIADRGYLLEIGHIVGEDSAANLARNTAVQEAYLGGTGEAAAARDRGPAAPELPPARPASTEPAAPEPAPPEPRPPMPAQPEPAPLAAAFPVSAQALAPASLRAPAQGSGSAAPGGELEPGTIAGLVQRATEIQAEHIQAIRSARLGRQPFAAPNGAGGGSLQEALALVEAAAARARLPVPEGQPDHAGPDGAEKDRR
ncbi:MAG: ABC transporter ATP-binding protein [SAR324 cluster bacterium]|nr:ABC transporter ATP-binding protein [SAR324 cluster bacterium]